MILFVITECAEKYRSRNWMPAKIALETAAQDEVLILPYSRLSPTKLQKLKPWAVCHSGSGTPFDQYDILRHRAYIQSVRECPVPQLGICAGHQLMAVFFGGKLGSMGRRRPQEPDLNPAYHPGFYKEWGIFPVQVIRPDPLFKGLPSTLLVSEYHREEVKRLPRGFQILARTPRCAIQAFKHPSRPYYGVQFHPEDSPEGYPHGRQILQNFFQLAH